ncbi:MAG: methyltransferase domain-containing protein [Firmicutes bacterium]|nr:methyltransferase domain-containing protein [Bacillota bacterium]
MKFKKLRTQPAKDLAARITNVPQTAVDIGCGPGNSTRILRDVFPEAAILGIDSSPNMIERAERENPDLSFRLCEATELREKYDLVFSNACLQWIPNHETLIPSLMEKLTDGGTFAAQMPMNSEEPLYRLIDEIVSESEWGFENMRLPNNRTLTVRKYYDILSYCSSAFDIWETKYYHILPNCHALVEWVKGTKLRPYLDFLGEKRGAELEREIEERAKPLYPPTTDGNIMFGFRRLFIIAHK